MKDNETRINFITNKELKEKFTKHVRDLRKKEIIPYNDVSTRLNWLMMQDIKEFTGQGGD